MSSDRYQAGLAARRAVLGDNYVNKATAADDTFNTDIQNLVTEYCWGEIWGRDALSRKQKSLNNLCMLAALNRGDQFKIHVRGAINNGCTVEEIKETLLQVAVYCGVPAGIQAFALAREVLVDMGQLEKGA